MPLTVLGRVLKQVERVSGHVEQLGAAVPLRRAAQRAAGLLGDGPQAQEREETEEFLRRTASARP